MRPRLLPLLAFASLALLGMSNRCDLTDVVYGEPNPTADVTGEWAMWVDLDSVGTVPAQGAGSVLLAATDPAAVAGPVALAGDSIFESAARLVCTKSGAHLSCGLGPCQLYGDVRGESSITIRGTTICGDRSGTWRAQRPEPPLRLFFQDSAPALAFGTTLDATVRVTDSYNWRLGRPLTAASSDTAVATVTARGQHALITAVGAGTATITVTAPAEMNGTNPDLAARLEVRCLPAPVSPP